MTCRVGMTTNPGERKRYWEKKHSNLRNWKILGHYKSKSKAQEAERIFAQKYGCVSYSGGRGNEHDDWVVYKFNY